MIIKSYLLIPLRAIGRMLEQLKVLWEANMDLLDENCELDLFDYNWRIYSVNPNQTPQYISPEAIVKESLVNEGCTIEGYVNKSVLFQGVTVKKGAI